MSPSSPREKVALIATAGVLGAIMLWAVITFFSNTPTARYGDDIPDYPVAARFCTVQSADTYWRAVRRSGEQADVARSEVVVLPAVELAVSDAGSGALRVLFRDESGDYVGDAITHSFSGGTFDESGTATIEFAATDGFEEESGYNAYRIRAEDRWTIEVLEGPSASASGDDYQSLFRIPITALRR